MKKHQMIDKLISQVAYKAAVQEANSSCRYFFGQPTLPEKVKKMRKF